LPSPAGTADAPESPRDYPKGKAGVAARWKDEIDAAEKAMRDWRDLGAKILDRYSDDDAATSGRSFNLLWSNVQTLQPAIYAQAPKPVVKRRYLDQDPAARVASNVLERAIETNVVETDDFNDAMKACCFDYLTPGRGATWLRYEPHFRTVQMPGSPAPASESDDQTPADAGVQVTNDGTEERRELTWEEVVVDYVHWSDFLHSPARSWNEVRWVGRKVYMTRDGLAKRFGERLAQEVPLDHKPDKDENEELFSRAVVVEIWDRTEREVLWVAPSYPDEVLDRQPDPLQLKDFFPCPRPVFATVTNDSLVPIPDYVFYQDQAEMLDELTNRCANIAKAIKVAGTYDPACGELARLLDEAVENAMIPAENFAQFAQGGRFEGAAAFMPIKEFVEALSTLNEVREQVKQDAYEVTGMSDILRGASNPEETATAQNIKSHFATLRLSDRQNDMARFARDNLRLAGEIIAKHFSPRTLLMISDYQQTDEFTADPAQGQQRFMQAMQLLRSDAQRAFRIDIETDSTIAADEQGEQQAGAQFVESIGALLNQALPAVQAYPALAPFLCRVVQFAVRRFPVGSELEASLDEAVTQLETAAAQGQHPQAQPAPGEGGGGPPQPGTPEHAAASAQAAQEQHGVAAAAAKAQLAQQQVQGAAIDNEGKQALTAAQLADYQSKTRDRDARLAMEQEAHQARLAMMGQEEIRKQQAHAEGLRLKSEETLARIAASEQRASAKAAA
jgi:hypothetical protein